MHTETQRRWREADAALDRLLDLPPGERAAALAALPDAIAGLVAQLMRAHGAGSVLDQSLGELLPAGEAAVGAADGQRLAAAGDPLGAGPPDAGAPDAHPPRADVPAPGNAGVPSTIATWTLGEVLGRGGMAIVYRAHRELAGGVQHAALKLLTIAALASDGSRRFLREQQLLARLSHPRIAALLDAGVLADGTPYLAMQLVEGVRIDHACRERGLDPRAIVTLFLQVCDAVAYAHRQLVVHRDLKPANILVDADGHVRLLDFGIARLLDDAAGSDSTRTEMLALTPQYAAPEQFIGEDTGTAADVFGLGAVLYQLLAGRPPRWPAQQAGAPITQPSRAAAEVHEKLPPPRSQFSRVLRGDLDAILLKALEGDPGRRYPDAAALADDLRRWLEGRPVQAARAGRAYRARKFVARNRGGVVAGVLLATAVLAGTIGTAWQAQRAEDAAMAARDSAARALDAQARSQAALARATELREFLVGLFTANVPDRPPEELPTTEELLHIGAERAGEPGIEPSLRADMLTTIGGIHLQRNQPQQAQPLIGRALAMVRAGEVGDVDVAAQTLLAQARLEDHHDREDRAEVLRREAIALLDAGGGSAQTKVRAHVDLGWLLDRRQRLEEAASEFRIAAEVAARADLSEVVRLDIDQRIAGVLIAQGRYPEARSAYQQVLRDDERVYGPHHRTLASHLVNSVGPDLRLGHFADAEAKILRAVAIYDRIGDEPSQRRATARANLGFLYLWTGQYDRALAVFDLAIPEFIASTPAFTDDTRAFPMLYRGMVMAEAQRWPEALVQLTEARRRLGPDSSDMSASLVHVESRLARGHCASPAGGGATTGEPMIAQARARLASQTEFDASLEALVEEAAAACAQARGAREDALAAIEKAVAIDAALPPGEAGAIARRACLHAALLEAAGRDSDAGLARARGLQRLRDANLAAHPASACLVPAMPVPAPLSP